MKKDRETKVYYVGLGSKVTTYYREEAGCTVSEYEIQEAERDLRKAEAYFAAKKESQ